MKKIVILNYGLGNVRSVGNALRAIGINATISRERQSILDADGLIIPGVGSFPQGMKNLSDLGLTQVIHKYVDLGKPLLGICLGMQILFDSGSEFSSTQGLGILPGSIDIVPLENCVGRLPHIAWSTLKTTNQGISKMFNGLNEKEQRFYFVHSYAAKNVPLENINGTVTYFNKEIIAAVQSGNIWGTQFHPEKSGPSGLRVLENFIDLC
jgi:imidazole glycerol-phosphate synthase subunit HisH